MQNEQFNVRYRVKFHLLKAFAYIEIAENFPIDFLDTITLLLAGSFFYASVQCKISFRQILFVTCLVPK